MRQCSPVATSPGGFTLLELVFGLAVFTVALAVAIPNFQRFVPRYRLRQAASDLYHHMHMTKSAAIKLCRSYSITYAVDPDGYQLDYLGRTVVLSQYGSGVRFARPDGLDPISRQTITFNSRGFSNQGYVHLSNAASTVYYRVGPLWSGVIRKQRWNGSNWQ